MFKEAGISTKAFRSLGFSVPKAGYEVGLSII